MNDDHLNRSGIIKMMFSAIVLELNCPGSQDILNTLSIISSKCVFCCITQWHLQVLLCGWFFFFLVWNIP